MNKELDRRDDELIDLGSATEVTKGPISVGIPDSFEGAKLGAGLSDD